MKPSDRETLLYCLQAALAAVDGRRVVADALRSCELAAGTPVLAVGKAAAAMLAGAADSLGPGLGPALCITREDAMRPGEPGVPHARLVFGDHPVPGRRSLAAGYALLEFLDRLPPGGELLALWSGGSSALAEQPVPGIRLAELAQVNRWLLASGLPIAAANRIRARLSSLKGGRLAARLTGRKVQVLAISDVPGDDPAAIGSGPWTPVRGAPADELPEWIRALLARAPLASTGESPAARVDYQIVANGRRALAAAGAAGAARGLPVMLHDRPLEGLVPRVAVQLFATLEQAPSGLHAWHGETTVELPAASGRGGRNSHLALSLAYLMADRSEFTVLCAATDGADGNSGASGGWADGGVLQRAAALGLDAGRTLGQADSGALLAATGDALAGMPTGTNVMDLVLALKR
jgi:glycerate 2-kinase